jgi:hypothetical protein
MDALSLAELTLMKQLNFKKLPLKGQTLTLSFRPKLLKLKTSLKLGNFQLVNLGWRKCGWTRNFRNFFAESERFLQGNIGPIKTRNLV